MQHLPITKLKVVGHIDKSFRTRIKAARYASIHTFDKLTTVVYYEMS